MNKKTGFILLHGSGLGSYIWDRVTPLLNAPFLCVDFPNRGKKGKPNENLSFDDYVKHAYKAIDKREFESFVLVTHSISGFIAMDIGREYAAQISGIIGVASVFPAKKNSFVQSLPFPQKLIMPLVLKLSGTRPPDAAIKKGLGNSLSGEDITMIVDRFTAESPSLFTTPVENYMLQVNRLYVKTTDDMEFPMSIQEKMANNLKAETTEIKTGHLPMLSEPQKIALLLNDFIDVVE
ncbi:MAG: alpha/beta hydrolase [Bacteroidetes bacterium]|nr:MAG: alpha/beta hydrolase [Bacteroidota bacterium]